MFPLPTWYNINILDKSLVLKRSVRIFVSVSVWTQFCTISWSVIFQLSHLHNADKCLTWMMQSWIHLGQKMCKVVWNPKINMKERCKTFIIECGLAKYKKHVPCYTAVSKIHRKSRILGLFYAGLCMGSYYWWHITDSQEYFNVYRDTFQNKTKQNNYQIASRPSADVSLIPITLMKISCTCWNVIQSLDTVEKTQFKCFKGYFKSKHNQRKVCYVSFFNIPACKIFSSYRPMLYLHL